MAKKRRGNSPLITICMVVLALALTVGAILLVYSRLPKPERLFTNTEPLGALTEESVTRWYEDFSDDEELSDADALLVCGYRLDELMNMLQAICADQGILPQLEDGYIILPSGYNSVIRKSLYADGAETIYGVLSDNTERLVICAIQ